MHARLCHYIGKFPTYKPFPLSRSAIMKNKEPISQSPRAKAEGTANGEQIPEWLGEKLKEMFSDVMTEPIPEDLVALLQQLEQRDKENRDKR